MNYELLADEVLVRLLQDSDAKAFDAIFNRYWKRIFLSAYKKLGSKEVAEDLTQNLFAALWAKRSVYRIDHLYQYLSVGIKNAVINQVDAEIVKQRFRKSVTEEATEANTDHQTVLKNLQTAIQQALSHLPGKTRAIFQLSKFEQQSVKEIATQFGISEKAVEYHITQSNKVVRLHLKEFIAFHLLLVLLSEF